MGFIDKEGLQHLWAYINTQINRKTKRNKDELTSYLNDELAKRNQLAPEFANSIEECTDTDKLYVLPDGYIYAYMLTDVPAYTNLADPSSADWLANKRFATSSINDFTGAYITNYIPCKPGDTIRMRGMDVVSQISSSPARTRMFYDGESRGIADYYVKTLVENGYGSYDAATGTYTFQLVDLSSGGTLPYTFNSIRQNFMLMDGYTVNDVIITVNEEIKSESGSGYAWASTGRAFVPANYEDRIVELEESAEDHETRLKLLEANESGSGVPAYWLEELENKAEAIQTAMEDAGRNKSAFLWYTDAHWPHSAKVSPALLGYLIRNTPMCKVNFGGDIVGDPASFTHENIKYVYEWRSMIADLPNHHSVPGNHDLDHNSTDVRDMVYAFLIAPEESLDMVVGGELYYYIDNPAEKTRYLYLDYMASDHAAMVAQGQFVVDAIKGVSDGWHIVVIGHRWFQYTSASAPTVGSVPAYEAEILSVLDAYNARTSRSGSNYFDTLDFAAAKGKVEMCIGGHIHVDYDFASDGGIPIILTASDTNQDRSSDETEDSGTVGTITEAAVYGIVADYTNGKISIIGVGRGGSREITL